MSGTILCPFRAVVSTLPTTLQLAMVLTDEHQAQFRESGYATVPGFLTSQEVAALQAEVARF